MNRVLRFSLLLVLVVVRFLLAPTLAIAGDFRESQLAQPRVAQAAKVKSAGLQKLFESKGVAWPPPAILLRGFKMEKELELWGKKADGSYALVKTYAICASSGKLGPKRTEGDGQVPEGFYQVAVFNPASRFHLSLGINYPNASDRKLGTAPYGGNIMVHGNCVTIGCVPIQDPNIEEVYLAAVEATGAGAPVIPVQLFPARLTDARMNLFRRSIPTSPLLAFWANLKEGYDRFEKDHRLPTVTVDAKGRYLFGGATRS